MIIGPEWKFDPQFERIIVAGWRIAVDLLGKSLTTKNPISTAESDWLLREFKVKKYETGNADWRSIDCTFRGMIDASTQVIMDMSICYPLGNMPNPIGYVSLDSFEATYERHMSGGISAPMNITMSPNTQSGLGPTWNYADDYMRRKKRALEDQPVEPIPPRPECFGEWS